ncbi:MAG: helix-hairpin-helix domain-containing protein [Myxococcota bacterium]|nr:helix-hairpin-helix domain-containing protein [Myxococcota bacterium]
MSTQRTSKLWRRLTGPSLAAFLVLSLAACDGGPNTDPYETSLRPGWYPNQEFHLESRYNNIIRHTDVSDHSADPAAADLGETLALVDDSLSEPAYWRYQVIEQGLNPNEGDDFYEYASMGGTLSPLTVIKASLDAEMNIGHELAGADPKIYMVIREDRLRMAGIVYFYTVNDERVSQAITVDEAQMNRSFNDLSQSNLSIIPHFVPPFPIQAENADRVLEDGQVVTFANATDTAVDVVYENSLDRTLIAESWEDGQPWATASITPTVESRLLSLDEVDEIKGDLAGTMSNHNDNEDFDYIELLKQPLNLSDALHVDEMLGTNTFEVNEGYRPWAGSWWRQSEAALVFGYVAGTNNTVSQLQEQNFRTPAVDMQNLGDELRDLRKDGQGSSPEYDEKVTEYREKQDELVDTMVDYYTAIRNGINGGQISIQDGNLKAAEGWHNDYDGFDLDLRKLSPLDKFALIQQLNGNTHGTNPWYGPAWELLNHWSPAGSSWFGHCNGWAAAAILTNEPREAVEVSFGSTNQFTTDLTPGDQKGLLSETYYSQLSSFYGSRYNGDDGDDISDLSPKAVLQILSTYIGQRGVPLVFDTSANEEVWNFPAWSYELTLTETTAGGSGNASGLININTAGPAELQTLWGINQIRAERIIEYRENVGPFQAIEDIVNVSGIGYGIFGQIKELITVSVATDLRSFDGNVRVRFATDGVGYAHVDTNVNQPQGFWKDWAFTLEASPAGEIISGQWDNDDNGHPDFAWVPYTNTVQSGRSENAYLHWTNLKSMLPSDTVRE